MSFIFMVFHWREPGRADTLAQSMREMRDVLADTPGCVAVEPPSFTQDGGCLVGIAKWESKQAFLASGFTLRPPDETVEGETRPRERFFLEEVETARP
jgi:Antibiotic biosynthesis monooxygenase